jgi:hypothetical protein
MGAITRGKKRTVGWPADQSGKRGTKMLKAKKKAAKKPKGDDDAPNYRSGSKKKRPAKR